MSLVWLAAVLAGTVLYQHWTIGRIEALAHEAVAIAARANRTAERANDTTDAAIDTLRWTTDNLEACIAMRKARDQ